MSIGPQGELEKWPGQSLVMDMDGFSEPDREVWWKLTRSFGLDFYDPIQESLFPPMRIGKMPQIF